MISSLYIYENASGEKKYYTDKYQVVYDCLDEIISTCDNSTVLQLVVITKNLIEGIKRNKEVIKLGDYGVVTRDEIIDNI